MNSITRTAQIPHNLHHLSAISGHCFTRAKGQVADMQAVGWWARQDSNLGPTDYESAALTS